MDEDRCAGRRCGEPILRPFGARPGTIRPVNLNRLYYPRQGDVAKRLRVLLLTSRFMSYITVARPPAQGADRASTLNARYCYS